MKKYLNVLVRTPMFLVFVGVIVIYGFSALGKPAEINEFAVVTAIGIDNAEDEEFKYEISLLTFIPIAGQNFSETYKVITAKGRSVSEALDFAGLNIGRQIGLSHVKTVVIDSDLLKEDITKFLDYLSRNKNVSFSTQLVTTDVKAKEFLDVAKQIDSESSIKISDLLTFNAEYIYSADSSFETFFKGLFSPTKVSLIPLLSISDGKAQEMAVSVGDSGQGGSASTSQGGDANQTSKSEIVNNGETVVFKNGKEVARLSGADMKKVNLVRGEFSTGSIQIDNVTDELFKNANLTFEIQNKTEKYRVDYKNNIPIFNIDIDLTLKLSEVESEEGMIETNIDFSSITDEAVKKIEKKAKKVISESIGKMRDNQTDIFDAYTAMHNANPRAFRKFMDSLEDKEDYLNSVVFKVGVRVFSQ